jgi:hypothetical protein
MFESGSKSEPNEEEKKVIERKLIEEGRSFLMDTFSALPEEEKKKKITERWKREKAKSKSKNIPWRLFEPKIGNALPLAGFLASKLNGVLLSGTQNGALLQQELARGASAQARTIENQRQQLRLKARLRRTPSSPNTYPPVGADAEKVPDAEKAVTDEGTEFPPEYTYTGVDTVTMPHIEGGVGMEAERETVGTKVHIYAEKRAATYAEDDPEFSASIQAFYEEMEEMLKRGDVDGALRFLDSNLGAGETNVWDSEMRSIALQLGEMKRIQYGYPEVDFDDITFVLSRNASGLLENFSETNEGVDKEGYDGLMTLLERIQDPTETGTRAFEEALVYSERLLAFRTGRLNSSLHLCDTEHEGARSKENRKEAEENRALVEETQRMRDAILQELEMRKERSSKDNGEKSPNAYPDAPESEDENVDFDALLANPNLEAPASDVEAFRLIIQQLEKKVLQGDVETDGGVFLAKRELGQVAQLLQEGTREVVDKIDTVLAGYLYRTIFQKVKEAINRPDIVIDYETKKLLLERITYSDKISKRHSSGRVHDMLDTQVWVDEMIHKLK